MGKAAFLDVSEALSPREASCSENLTLMTFSNGLLKRVIVQHHLMG